MKILKCENMKIGKYEKNIKTCNKVRPLQPSPPRIHPFPPCRLSDMWIKIMKKKIMKIENSNITILEFIILRQKIIGADCLMRYASS